MWRPGARPIRLEYSASHGPGNAQGTRSRRATYRVDPTAVADAILRGSAGLPERRALQNECSYPDSSPLAVGEHDARPAPSTTEPTQVRVELGPAGARASRRQADAQLVVLAGGRRERPRVDPELIRDLGHARRRAAAPPATARSAPRCGARDGRRRSRARRRGRSSPARRRCGQRPPVVQPRLAARVTLAQRIGDRPRRGPRRRARRAPRAPRPAAPSVPVTATRSPGRAPSRPTSSPGSSAQPDDRERHGQRRTRS